MLPIVPSLWANAAFWLVGALLCFPITPLRERALAGRPHAVHAYRVYLAVAWLAVVAPFATGVAFGLTTEWEWGGGSTWDQVELGLTLGAFSGLPLWATAAGRIGHEAGERRRARLSRLPEQAAEPLR